MRRWTVFLSLPFLIAWDSYHHLLKQWPESPPEVHEALGAKASVSREMAERVWEKVVALETRLITLIKDLHSHPDPTCRKTFSQAAGIMLQSLQATMQTYSQGCLQQSGDRQNCGLDAELLRVLSVRMGRFEETVRVCVAEVSPLKWIGTQPSHWQAGVEGGGFHRSNPLGDESRSDGGGELRAYLKGRYHSGDWAQETLADYQLEADSAAELFHFYQIQSSTIYARGRSSFRFDLNLESDAVWRPQVGKNLRAQETQYGGSLRYRGAGKVQAWETGFSYSRWQSNPRGYGYDRPQLDFLWFFQDKALISVAGFVSTALERAATDSDFPNVWGTTWGVDIKGATGNGGEARGRVALQDRHEGQLRTRLFPEISLELKNRPFYRLGLSPRSWETRFSIFLGPVRSLWAATALRTSLTAGVGKEFLPSWALSADFSVAHESHDALPGGQREDLVWDQRLELRYELSSKTWISLPLRRRVWTLLHEKDGSHPELWMPGKSFRQWEAGLRVGHEF